MLYVNVTILIFIIRPEQWIWDHIVDLYDLSWIKQDGGVVLRMVVDTKGVLEDDEPFGIMALPGMIVETTDNGQIHIYEEDYEDEEDLDDN